jgi:hypothetical protein
LNIPKNTPDDGVDRVSANVPDALNGSFSVRVGIRIAKYAGVADR